MTDSFWDFVSDLLLLIFVAAAVTVGGLVLAAWVMFLAGLL